MAHAARSPPRMWSCRSAVEGAASCSRSSKPTTTRSAASSTSPHRGRENRAHPAPAGKLPPEYMKKLDVVTPNETEAELITGLPMRTKQDAPAAARMLLAMGVKAALITLGKNGAYATDGRISRWIEPIAVEAVDTTGAGDAFQARRGGARRGHGLSRPRDTATRPGRSASRNPAPRPPCRIAGRSRICFTAPADTPAPKGRPAIAGRPKERFPYPRNRLRRFLIIPRARRRCGCRPS